MKCNTLLKNFFFFLHIYVYTFEINKKTNVSYKSEFSVFPSRKIEKGTKKEQVY
jgi:hypothetical protein